MRIAIARRAAAALFVAALFLSAAPARAAGPDNNVEWTGVSHIPWQDRLPLCPVDGESFSVRFQTWRDDITSARVLVTAGAVTTPVAAALAGTRGPYDVWQATLPATAAATESYVIELSDGSDTDYLSAGGMSDAPPADGGFALDFNTFAHAPIGATRTTGGGVVFKVWAPTRSTTHVRGDFNGWGTGNPLTKVGEYFVGRAPSVADRSEYKYFFNGAVWNTDPRARSLDASTGPYNAYIENPLRYTWKTTDFATPPLDQMVVYQLHVGTFSGRNDPYGAASTPATYLDAAKRVGHLAELGVNAVMLNPITEFPGDESAGYNPITQWAPEWKYGTPDQFKALVDSLHGRGIAVILDVVWNHFSTNDNFLWNYDGSQQWFDTPAVDTPWGSQADFDKQAVRDYYADAALYWLQEYKVDGFRMDATSYMRIAPQDASGLSLMRRLNDEIDNRWADKVTIAEQLPDDPVITEPTSLGGAGFDAQYHMAFRDNLRQALFAGPAGDPQMSSIRAIVLGSGTYLNGHSVLNYFQLHDEAWPSSGGQRLVKTIDPTAPYDNADAQGRMKLALGLTLLAPGVPAMLMGDEWLDDTDFGSSAGNRIDWSKQVTYAPYYSCIQRLIQLRRGVDAFRADRSVNVLHLNEGGNVIGFYRTDSHGNPYLVMANFGNTTYPVYRIGAPRAGAWNELINTQAPAYGGVGPDNGALATDAVPYDGQTQSLVVSLPAASVLVLAPHSLLAAPAGPSSTDTRIERLAPVPARDGAAVEFVLAEVGAARVEVLDVTGRRMQRIADGTFAAGHHIARWSGRDETGRSVPAGIYFVCLVTAHGTEARRLPLLR